jgi:hypothetical protein
MTGALLVVCVAAWAVYGGMRRTRARPPRSRDDLLRVLSGVVERARETPPGAADPEDAPGVPGVVMMAGRPTTDAATMATPLPRPKRASRRPRSMNPAAVAARRARANRRAADAKPVQDLIVIRFHEDEPIVTLGAPERATSIDRARARRRLRGRLRRVTGRALLPLGIAAVAALVGLVVYKLTPVSDHNPGAANASTTGVGVAAPAHPIPPLSPNSTPTTLANVRPLATSTTGAIVSSPVNYHLGMTATGPCWVRVTDVTTGLVVMEAVLQPGEHRDLTLSGPVMVRLGNRVAASLTVEGVPIAIDRTSPSPFDVAFTGKG